MNDKIKLFSLCFGDSEESACEFFSIADIETITEYAHGELVSMASLVPLKTESGLCGFYAYGVCVHEDHRGKGLFARIMERCEEYAREMGADFVCLIPADHRLANTYMRFGYTERVELCDGDLKDKEPIYTLSPDFIRFAESEEDRAATVDFGLLKFIKDVSGKKFAFFSHMGDR